MLYKDERDVLEGEMRGLNKSGMESSDALDSREKTIAILLSLIHISEPTRLGMISYAVFCLKKKNGGKCETWTKVA